MKKTICSCLLIILTCSLTLNTYAHDKPFRTIGDDNDNILHGKPGKIDIIHGLGGNDYINGLDRSDYLYGAFGNDELYGGSGDDELDGFSGNDELYGGSGNDTLVGGTGTDELYGGSGTDTLYGCSGNNTLDGGSGNDILYGGSSDDEYIYKISISGEPNIDNILDYGGNNDTLYIESLDSYTHTTNNGNSYYQHPIYNQNVIIIHNDSIEHILDLSEKSKILKK